MAADAVERTPDLPPGYGPEVVIRFFPEYGTQHPLWCWFGYRELADLRLPADLAARLHRWSAFWDSTFRWDDGWPPGSPEAWWTDEEERLPRDVAIAFGSDFVVEAGDRFLRSPTGPGSPASAAALHALIDAEIEEQRRIRAAIAAGGRFDFIGPDGTSFTTWLAERQSDDERPSR